VSPPLAIFDLDGTVWDSAPGILSCMEATLEEFGLPHPGAARLHEMLGPPLLTTLAGLGVAEHRLDEARVVYRRHYRDRGEFEASLYDGIVDVLDRLRAAGFQLATATSKGSEPTRRMLDHFDIARRFDVIAAASMTATGHSKVEIIAEAVHAAGDRDPALITMVGDRSFDIEGGRHSGYRTVGVSWGYAPDGEFADVTPDHVVHSPTELEALLLGKQFPS